MASRSIPVNRLDIPRFKWKTRKGAHVFDLSSHARAREALSFGLSMRTPGFNIFVLGPDRAGRMTETMAFVKQELSSRPPVDDWVYLNNFTRPHRPKPYPLPPGTGRRLRDAMQQFVADLRAAFVQAFQSDDYKERVEAAQARTNSDLERTMTEIHEDAGKAGLGIFHTERGPMVAPADPSGQPMQLEQVPEADRERMTAAMREVADRLNAAGTVAVHAQAELQRRLSEINRQLAEDTCSVILTPVAESFAGLGLTRWFVALKQDVMENLAAFAPAQKPQPGVQPPEPPERRYAVNLLVDNGDMESPPLVLEASPSYENLVGRIQYRPGEAHLETDFTLIRAGALHRANGGVLVLRADDVAAFPGSWQALVAALRDSSIRIEEPHRQNTVPMIGAPSPKDIPLDVKVILVGSAMLYYAGFSKSPQFQALFKVKADIDHDMKASAADCGVYGSVLNDRAKHATGRTVSQKGISFLLGLAARWAGDRTRLAASLERLDDVISEAAERDTGKGAISEEALVRAVAERRQRNNRIEVHGREMTKRGIVLIETDGAVVGQVNALTVRDTGDHSFGAPSRVTAQTSVGNEGVINIERQVAMGGPIQQKGAMVLQGYLAGTFARHAPISFNASITFEQNYGGVEGDSASLAELAAILSDLAGVPIRQDLAITGSVNQHGIAQAVGGVLHKVEGFFQVCDQNGLTGTQGVIVPRSNADSLVLDDPVAAAVKDGKFHLYTVDRVEDAVELLTGVKPGRIRKDGTFPPDTLFGMVQAQLASFERALRLRGTALAGHGGSE
ncbi:MAG: AAA family ATPase [Alphaproteobacteria bacterium]